MDSFKAKTWKCRGEWEAGPQHVMFSHRHPIHSVFMDCLQSDWWPRVRGAFEHIMRQDEVIAALEAEVRQLKMEREGITEEDIEDTMPPPRTIER